MCVFLLLLATPVDSCVEEGGEDSLRLPCKLNCASLYFFLFNGGIILVLPAFFTLCPSVQLGRMGQCLHAWFGTFWRRLTWPCAFY